MQKTLFILALEPMTSTQQKINLLTMLVSKQCKTDINLFHY
jgi:hypothetical protein